MVQTRDSQRQKVYQWQNVAFPDYRKQTPMTPQQAYLLIRQITADVLAAGGKAHGCPKVSFTKRRGGACAYWGELNFTPGQISRTLVLHEMAHALTYGSHGTFDLGVRDYQGHGPQYVACYIALCAHYDGRDPVRAVQAAKCFDYLKTKTVHARMKFVDAYFPVARRERVTVKASVQVDHRALIYWTNLFEKVESRAKAA